jgi:hypothetical protein
MSGFSKVGLVGVVALLACTGSVQGSNIFPLQSHAMVAASGGAAGQGRGSTKRALVDVDHQKLRHIIKPGETLEWKGVHGTSDFYIHFAPGQSPCEGNDYRGSANTPATCVVNADVPSATEFPYEIVKDTPGIQPAAYYYQVRSCSGCNYSTE